MQIRRIQLGTVRVYMWAFLQKWNIGDVKMQYHSGDFHFPTFPEIFPIVDCIIFGTRFVFEIFAFWSAHLSITGVIKTQFMHGPREFWLLPSPAHISPLERNIINCCFSFLITLEPPVPGHKLSFIFTILTKINVFAAYSTSDWIDIAFGCLREEYQHVWRHIQIGTMVLLMIMLKAWANFHINNIPGGGDSDL